MIEIPRELLRQAYPAGYLAMRGVTTVGGYHCVNAQPATNRTQGCSQWAWCGHVAFLGHPAAFGEGAYVIPAGEDEGEDARSVQRALGNALDIGLLLPQVDPSDPATWACLLTDLWRQLTGKPHAGVVTLHTPSNYGEPWMLHDPGEDVYSLDYPDLPVLYGEAFWWERELTEDIRERYRERYGAQACTQDPALALVHARAALLSKEAATHG